MYVTENCVAFTVGPAIMSPLGLSVVPTGVGSVVLVPAPDGATEAGLVGVGDEVAELAVDGVNEPDPREEGGADGDGSNVPGNVGDVTKVGDVKGEGSPAGAEDSAGAPVVGGVGAGEAEFGEAVIGLDPEVGASVPLGIAIGGITGVGSKSVGRSVGLTGTIG